MRNKFKITQPGSIPFLLLIPVFMLPFHAADAESPGLPSAESKGGSAEFVPSRILTYKQMEGAELKLHVFEPDGHQSSDKRPVVVFFFGGGWVSGTAKQFYQQAQYLADRGVVGISAEYRIKNRHQTTPFDAVEDGKSAVRWVRNNAAQLGIDPSKVIAAGGSAGGHVAVCAALIKGLEGKGEDLSVSSVPDGLVLFNPVLDTTENGYGIERVGKDRKTDVSPCHHVHPIKAPTIVSHGTVDKTVPFENAERFTRLMKEAGNDCQLVAFEGERHTFFNGSFFWPERNDDNFNKTMEDTMVFLNKYGFLTTTGGSGK